MFMEVSSTGVVIYQAFKDSFLPCLNINADKVNKQFKQLFGPNLRLLLFSPSLAIMVSLRNTLLALASAVAVSADYWIEPTSVPLSTRRTCDPGR
jgi:hypothetical protein